MKHFLPGVNGKIYGVTFRESYAVVEKNSKIYFQLKRMPVFKNSGEFSLTMLGKLPFISRAKDIINIFGKEVYTKYLIAVEEERIQAKLAEKNAKLEEDKKRREQLELQEQLETKLKEAQGQEDSEKIEEIQSQMPQVELCTYTTVLGTLCKFEQFELSPGKHCKMHLLKDEKLKDLGIEVPLAMTISERKKFKKSAINKLQKLKKSGAF
jgi:hypothetical protein